MGARLHLARLRLRSWGKMFSTLCRPLGAEMSAWERSSDVRPPRALRASSPPAVSSTAPGRASRCRLVRWARSLRSARSGGGHACRATAHLLEAVRWPTGRHSGPQARTSVRQLPHGKPDWHTGRDSGRTGATRLCLWRQTLRRHPAAGGCRAAHAGITCTPPRSLSEPLCVLACGEAGRAAPVLFRQTPSEPSCRRRLLSCRRWGQQARS